MPNHRTAEHWNEHYQTNDLPWDSGIADHNLLDTLAELDVSRQTALEIGCGTGTNSIALAQHGFATVIATDIATGAIERAREKATAANANIEFHLHDFLSDAAIPGVEQASIDFVFDRGVFHSVSDADRVLFAQRVAELLRPAGWWLSLCGNADDLTSGGPPRLTAAQITAVVEPCFEIHNLSRARFRDVKQDASSVFLNWRVLMRKRSQP